MGYRDDFYTAENIYGYTGTASFNPTVYFLEELDDDIYRFGRITQDHEMKINIGRNLVQERADYDVYNQEFEGGDVRCVEYYRGKVRHVSRNPLVLAEDMPAVQFALLVRSIHLFTEQKKLTTGTASERYAGYFGQGAGEAYEVIKGAMGKKPKVTLTSK